MRRHVASKTADIAAAVRAAHRRYDRPVVFDDPYALELTSPAWRWVCRSPWLHWLVVQRLFGPFRGVHAEMLGRARYAEELLQAAVERGVHQYVIVGAGLDSFALRCGGLAEQLRVFEVDHPASQALKRMRLARVGPQRLEHVEFVAADLECETLAGALSRSGYARWSPACFSWLGNTYYLGRPAIETTLHSIAAIAAPGSELVLDYARPAESLPAAERRAFRAVQAAVRRRGEPLRSFFEPGEFEALAEGCGFECIGSLDPQGLQQRYFADRHDDLRPPAWGHLLHLRLLQ